MLKFIQHNNLILLGEVDYMNYTMSLGSVKNQILMDIQIHINQNIQKED